MKPLLKAETYTSGSLPHEPVITIKTWQEEFDEKSREVNNWINQDGSTFETTGMSIKETKQFISDLRKKDEEELIKMLDNKKNLTVAECEWNSDIEIFKQLIKDYYKK